MSRTKTKDQWVPDQASESSVVAWRAVAPQLKKRTASSVVSAAFTRGASGSMGLGAANKIFTGGSADQLMGAQRSAIRDADGGLATSPNRHMAAYEIACLEMSERLSKEEETTLRASGALPEWFVPALRDSAANIHRESKH